MYIKFYLRKKFVLKTLAFCMVFLAISLSCLALSQNKNQPTETQDGICLPIIMYHFISKNEDNKNKFTVSLKTFEEDLEYIKENGYETILIKDLIDYTEGKSQLPQKPILLTFDDGAYSNYLYAFESAKKYNMKFVFSPIVKETEKYSKIKDENPLYAHASWEHMSEMLKSGLVEIQNHTYNMHETKKTRLGCTKKAGESFEVYKEKLSKDLNKAQDLIEEKLGMRPTAFFYPFGAFSKESEEVIKEIGFKATFLCESKLNYIKKSPECLYKLNRFIRPPGIPSKKFFKNFEK